MYAEEITHALGLDKEFGTERDLGEVGEISSLDGHALSKCHALVGDRTPARTTENSRDGVARIGLESNNVTSGGLK